MVNRITRITAELSTVRHEYVLRRGRIGALRELLRINDFIDMDGSPKQGSRLTPFARLYFSQRGGLVAAALRQVHALRAKNRIAEHVPTNPSIRKEIVPHSVTMLVPDNRIDRRVLLSGRSLFQAGWQVTIISAPYPEPIDNDQLDFPELSIIRVDTTRSIRIPSMLCQRTGFTMAIGNAFTSITTNFWPPLCSIRRRCTWPMTCRFSPPPQ